MPGGARWCHGHLVRRSWWSLSLPFPSVLFADEVVDHVRPLHFAMACICEYRIASLVSITSDYAVDEGSTCGTLRQATLGFMLKTFVRQATADDLELLEAIENEADALFATVFSIVGWQPAPSYADPSQQGGFILVASDNPGSDPIGFAHVLGVPGGSHLEQLSVRPSAAHRGHGRSLVEAVKSESRLRGCKRVTLRTFADVPWNAPFYVSCGFIERGPDSDFLRDLSTAEQQRGLGYGRRIQMNFDLTDEPPR